MVGDMYLPVIRALHDQKELEEYEKENEFTSHTKVSNNYLGKFFEAIEEALSINRGKYGSPLAYVIRKPQIPPPLDDDPAVGYPSINDELVKRTPIIFDGIIGASDDPELSPAHHTVIFKADSQTVLKFLREVLEDSFMWVRVKNLAKTTKNGRLFLKALFEHYLGRKMFDHQVADIEIRLANAEWVKDTRNWDFPKLVDAHVEIHNIADNLKACVYSGLDEHSKVRHLLRDAKHPMMEYTKTLIASTPAKCNSFDQSSVLMLDTYRQHHAERPAGIRQVSETITGRVSRPTCAVGGGGGDVVCGVQGGGNCLPSKSECDTFKHITLCW